MKELSLNVLDITKNSVRAKAKNILVSLSLDEGGMLTLVIKDDGCGMDEETLKRVSDPFYTTRTTRKVGMGIPLLKLASEQAGGEVKIESTVGVGTCVTATFDTTSLDFTPIGDMVSTVVTLIMGAPEIDFLYLHTTPVGEVKLDTRELRAVLGDNVSLDSFEVVEWMRGYLTEQYEILGGINP